MDTFFVLILGAVLVAIVSMWATSLLSSVRSQESELRRTVETGDHIRLKAERRRQDMVEWDRQFKALEPPPVPTGYEEIVAQSVDGSVVSTYKVPTYY